MNEQITWSRVLSTGVLFILMAALILILLTPNAAAASEIYGTVMDAETREPIEGATVYFYVEGDKENYHKTATDPRGYYTIDCDPGDHTIYISRDGYNDHKEVVTIDGQVEHNVALTPGSSDKDDPKDDYPDKDYPDKDYPDKEELDQEEKLGQPMINLALIRDWGTVGLFVLPGFRERTFAGVHGRPRIIPRVEKNLTAYE